MEQLKKYLRNFIDEDISIEKYIPNKLSIIIKNSYFFYNFEFLGKKFLLVKPREEMSIDILQRQLMLIQEKTQLKAILVEMNLTLYKRKKLIEKRIPFITENKQMFLPFMGIDLSLKNEVAYKSIDAFAPTTQLVFLYCLYNMNNAITQKELAVRLNMSQMTISRALTDLINLKLIQYYLEESNNRKRIYYIQDRTRYYENGKQYLINPILKTVYVDSAVGESVKLLKSGLEALSEKSMLSAPNRKVRAVYKEEYNRVLNEYEIAADVANEDRSYMQVQVLKYNPKILTNTDCVDPVTMICTITNKDERIEQAIEEMMEEFNWYKE